MAELGCLCEAGREKRRLGNPLDVFKEQQEEGVSVSVARGGY